MAWLFLLLTILPLVELSLLLTMGHYTSVGFTLAFVIITGILGAALLRYQGLFAWRNVQRDLSQGKMPTDSLLDGVMIVVAATLLITPGVLTDIFGITLLIPFCRRFYRFVLARWFRARFHVSGSAASADPRRTAGRSEVIDSYVIDHAPQDKTDPPAT